MKKYFFTFSELLLISGVAAIVVALATAAASSLATAPEVAVCAEIIRGLETKLTKYENDNDGKITPVYIYGKRWGRQLVDAGYFDEEGFYGTNRVYPKNFECPAETRQRNNGRVDVRHPSVNVAKTYDYGLNWYVHKQLKTKENTLPKRSTIKNPAKLMRLTEGTIFRITANITDGTARHGKQSAANVLYFDGHVEFTEMVPFLKNKNYDKNFWYAAK